MNMRVMALVVGMIVLLMYTSRPMIAQADAPPIRSPGDRSAEHLDDLTPEQRAQMVLDVEILHRCVLWNTYQHVSLLTEQWRILEGVAGILTEAEEADKQGLFDRYKREISAAIADTPAKSWFADLRAQLIVPYDAFDWVGVQRMIESTHLVLFLASQEEYETYSQNDARLAQDNPAALHARIPDDCPSSQRR